MLLQTSAETLILPVWLTVVLLAVTIPLGLLSGYLAYRGLKKGRHRTAKALAVGLILLTAVDAVLGFSVTFNDVELLTQSGALVRTVTKLAGLALILYAIYAPVESARGTELVDD
jgi:predicted Abi (CAAX) family protease